MTSTKTVADLKKELIAILVALREIHGERSTAIGMIGVPIARGHDRFAASVYGPCLPSRGLLAWGTRAITRSIDDGDTSAIGNRHLGLDAILVALREIHGERSTAIIMIGVPIAGDDLLAASVYGPRLSSRGLLAWGTRAITTYIDDGDTSANGNRHLDLEGSP